jgi:hypothetical protein
MGWLILIAILKLYIVTEKTFLCAGVYAAVGTTLALIGGASFLALLIGAAVSFALASGYFFVLSLIDGGGLWWLAAVGLPIALATGQAFLIAGAA